MSTGEEATASAPPRVYFVASQTLPRHGMETALMRTAEALSEQLPCQVLVLRPQASDDKAAVPVTALGRGKFGRAIAVWRLWRLLRRAGPNEIFIGTGLWAAVPLVLVHGRSRAAVIAWEHSLLPGRFQVDRKLRLLSPLVGYAYGRCRSVVCVSTPVAETIRRRWPKTHVQVIPNVFRPTKTQGRQAAEASSRVHVAFIGSLRPVKNVTLLIQSLRHLPKTYCVLVAGSGPQASALRALAEELGVSDRIEWLGATDGPDEVLARADVLAHPSSAETFAYTLLEACSASVPVATLDRPVMNSLVPEYTPGIVAEAPTPDGFARAVVRASTEFAKFDFGAAQALCATAFSPEGVCRSWTILLSGEPLPKPCDSEGQLLQQMTGQESTQPES